MSDRRAPSIAAAVLKAAGWTLLVLVLVAAFVFRNEVLRASLDPKEPFQTYRPPRAPDYARRAAWALLPPDPGRIGASDGPVDVFFVHPTTYSGGEEWNGPVDYPRASRELTRVMLPNYAGPFARVGRVFAPRYRQASVYAMVSLREDALDARRFAYGDVRTAFRTYLAKFSQGRPFILVGVEQGGSLAARLLQDEIAPNPQLRARLVAAYFPQTLAPADEYGPRAPVPACTSRQEGRCVVAYFQVPLGQLGAGRRSLGRAMVWSRDGELEPLGTRPALCVNPLLGAASDALAPVDDNLGAANATDLEWGVQPAFLANQVSAQCRGGLLWVSRPRSPSLKPVGGWVERQKPPGFNLFYGDLEADALARLRALQLSGGLPAPPITVSIPVRHVPVMGR